MGNVSIRGGTMSKEGVETCICTALLEFIFFWATGFRLVGLFGCIAIV